MCLSHMVITTDSFRHRSTCLPVGACAGRWAGLEREKRATWNSDVDDDRRRRRRRPTKTHPPKRGRWILVLVILTLFIMEIGDFQELILGFIEKNASKTVFCWSLYWVFRQQITSRAFESKFYACLCFLKTATRVSKSAGPFSFNRQLLYIDFVSCSELEIGHAMPGMAFLLFVGHQGGKFRLRGGHNRASFSTRFECLTQ
jgi:hypothetical protein